MLLATLMPTTQIMQENKNTILAYVDAFNRGDIDALCRLFSPDAMIYGVLGRGNLDKVKPIWKALFRSFDMSLTVDAIIAEGNMVAVRYTECGKPMQPCENLMHGDVPGGSYEMVAMEWFEIKNGVIHRRWCARDTPSVFKPLRRPAGQPAGWAAD